MKDEDLKKLETQIAQLTDALSDMVQKMHEHFSPLCDAVEKALAVMHNHEFADKVINEAEKALAEATETPEFHEGELIVCQNGDTFEIGEIKRLCDEGAFVWYHEGNTASLTPFENMHKLQNAYCIKQTSFALDRNAEE
jgi:hypothetical protein